MYRNGSDQCTPGTGSLARLLSAAGMAVGAAALLALLPGQASAQARPHGMPHHLPNQDTVWMPPQAQAYKPYSDFEGKITPYHVQGNVWVMEGEPGWSNVVVQVGHEGVLVVDTGVASMAPQLVAAIKALADKVNGPYDQADCDPQSSGRFCPVTLRHRAIRWIIDTDGLPDHIGGNAIVRLAGKFVVGGNFEFDNPGLTPGAYVIAHQNVLDYMVQQDPQTHQTMVPQALWPSQTYTEDMYGLRFDGEAVLIHYQPHANTDGNSMVMFRSSDVIATGDALDMRHFPIIDVARGGTIDGELRALNHDILEAVPAHHQNPNEFGTMVVPGHGRVGDQYVLVQVDDLLTVIRNRVMYYKDQGKTLEQVLALRPSSDYDERWGPTRGPWTTRDFITAVYKTLPAKGPVFSMRTVTLVPSSARVSGGKTY